MPSPYAQDRYFGIEMRQWAEKAKPHLSRVRNALPCIRFRPDELSIRHRGTGRPNKIHCHRREQTARKVPC